MRSFLLLLTLGLAAGRPEDPPADIAGGVEATRGVSKDARITPGEIQSFQSWVRMYIKLGDV